MVKLLANENVAADVVTALRADGHDVSWVREVGPGSTDDESVITPVAEGHTWEGHFAVAEEGRLRIVALPTF